MQQIRVGIIGAGRPGSAHGKGYHAAGGYKLVAVADLIPQRRKQLMMELEVPKEYASADDLLADKNVEAVSVCVPNHLHAPVTVAALKAGKHVLCELPPAMDGAEARRMQKSAEKAGKVLMYCGPRRFGPHEQAARQAIEKGYAGDVYHVRASWMRTRGIPLGTGWFTQKEKSGGGALIDIGVHMLDLAWSLLGQPKPTSAYGVTYEKFRALVPADAPHNVDDAAFGIVRFEGNKTIELGASWAINQPPSHNGAMCRAYGEQGAIEVYTPAGAVLYHKFDEKGQCKQTALNGPKVVHHAAIMRHFRDCIGGKSQPQCGGAQGAVLMEMIEAIYRSSAGGRSVAM